MSLSSSGLPFFLISHACPTALRLVNWAVACRRGRGAALDVVEQPDLHPASRAIRQSHPVHLSGEAADQALSPALRGRVGARRGIVAGGGRTGRGGRARAAGRRGRLLRLALSRPSGVDRPQQSWPRGPRVGGAGVRADRTPGRTSPARTPSGRRSRPAASCPRSRSDASRTLCSGDIVPGWPGVVGGGSGATVRNDARHVVLC